MFTFCSSLGGVACIDRTVVDVNSAVGGGAIRGLYYYSEL